MQTPHPIPPQDVDRLRAMLQLYGLPAILQGVYDACEAECLAHVKTDVDRAQRDKVRDMVLLLERLGWLSPGGSWPPGFRWP